MALEDVIILIVAVILLAIALFVGDKIFGNRKVEFTGSYFIKALLTAVVIMVIIIGVSAVVGRINILGIGQIVPILSFVLGVYAIKIILMVGATYERSTWVGVIAWLVVYIINYISETLFNVHLIDFI
ncbi:MAG: hypothetical protein INQ03_17635 [Candidatus Heimdallarchaeota archaeon]|nr:hypothetical protein [Candidatus Heimdallarchaeota archaeon]